MDQNDKVKIKLLRNAKGSDDGFNVRHFEKDEEATVSKALADALVTEGSAEKIDTAKDGEKALHAAPANKAADRAPENKAAK